MRYAVKEKTKKVSSGKFIIDSLGWFGALASLLAYSMNSLNMIGSQSMEYLALNVIGCFFLIIYTYSKKAFANSILNSIWLFMTIIAMVKIFFI
jgi:fluoride ion exporter CrcB/FEX